MNTEKIKVVEKATGNVYEAFKIDGGYQLFTLSHDPYKKLKDSTVKRYYRLCKEEDRTAEKPKATEKKAPAEVEELSTEKRESLINKIRKILSLSKNNPSQEEAIAAALQAQKLMAKYNIHEDEVTLEEIKDEIDSVFSQQKHDSQLHNWRKVLATIVAKNFRCKCYMHNGDVVFRGYKEDAKIALEVYMSLYTIGDKLGSRAYMEQKNRTGSGKGAYNSFTAGFLSGVEEGFNVQCTALMIITPKEVEEEFVKFSEDFVKGRKVTMRVNDSDLYKQGKAEGKAAVKARAIEKKGGKK